MHLNPVGWGVIRNEHRARAALTLLDRVLGEAGLEIVEGLFGILGRTAGFEGKPRLVQGLGGDARILEEKSDALIRAGGVVELTLSHGHIRIEEKALRVERPFGLQLENLGGGIARGIVRAERNLRLAGDEQSARTGGGFRGGLQVLADGLDGAFVFSDGLPGLGESEP